jgi:hypothetical protein
MLLVFFGFSGKTGAQLFFDRVFGGFSYQALDAYRSGSPSELPISWILMRTLFILSIGNYFQDDFALNGEFVLVRVGKEKFIQSKFWSLLIYCILYNSCLVISILLCGFIIGLSFFPLSLKLFPYFIFLTLTSFVEGLLFEWFSIRFNKIFGFLAFVGLLFLSMFTKIIFFISSYTMFTRWSQANLLSDHWLILLVWLALLSWILYLAIKHVVLKKDLILRKEAES